MNICIQCYAHHIYGIMHDACKVIMYIYMARHPLPRCVLFPFHTCRRLTRHNYAMLASEFVLISIIYNINYIVLFNLNIEAMTSQIDNNQNIEQKRKPNFPLKKGLPFFPWRVLGDFLPI